MEKLAKESTDRCENRLGISPSDSDDDSDSDASSQEE
jgi:hypothetical protein